MAWSNQNTRDHLISCVYIYNIYSQQKGPKLGYVIAKNCSKNRGKPVKDDLCRAFFRAMKLSISEGLWKTEGLAFPSHIYRSTWRVNGATPISLGLSWPLTNRHLLGVASHTVQVDKSLRTIFQKHIEVNKSPQICNILISTILETWAGSRPHQELPLQNYTPEN